MESFGGQEDGSFLAKKGVNSLLPIHQENENIANIDT